MSITVHILYCPSVQPVEIVFVVHYKIKNNQQIVSYAPLLRETPVAPVPQALFVSGTIQAVGPPSPNSDTSVIPCLLDLKVSPTKDFLKKHLPHNGLFSCRWRWPT